VALLGRLWAGGVAPALDDGVVVLDSDGRICALGPASQIDAPPELTRLGGASSWVGPGIVDAHVHLAFGAPSDVVARGVVATRDLGAPPDRAAAWRTTGGTPPAGSPVVAVAGPILTAPDGYPSQGWGADGFALFVRDAGAARAAVAALLGHVDVVKVALEPAGGPLLAPPTLLAIVDAAHDAGLAVVAHALTVETVRMALRAGVDELAHTPVEVLPADVVEQIAANDVLVVSTIQTFVDGSKPEGAGAIANAAALYAAGVRLAYGSDLGNAGTSPGVDPRELQRLADAGLGADGALRAATMVAGQAAGIQRPGELVVGDRADVVVLSGDPLTVPELWRSPVAVFAGGAFVAGTFGPPRLH
jgi:imidazolonepropionase-like amidohydrolase